MQLYPEPTAPVDFAATLESLPPIYPDATLSAQIRTLLAQSHRKWVVLDDDPTGAQAMSDVFVLTEWSVEALARELSEPRALFFVLTDTRSLPRTAAVARLREISGNLALAARREAADYSIVIRGDSTLRGHFPHEEEATANLPILLIPFFAEGGRYTINDTQWARERHSDGHDRLWPVAVTPYGQDLTFGYRCSNLRNWVVEKSEEHLTPAEVDAISLATLRACGPDLVAHQLAASRRHTTICNAADYRDLEVLACGMLRAESAGKRFIVRCAASFVRVLAGQGDSQPAKKYLFSGEGEDLEVRQDGPGLFIIGSHVPKTSTQLAALLNDPRVVHAELHVPTVLRDPENVVAQLSRWLNSSLAEGHHAIIYTSREVEPRGRQEGLAAAGKICEALVAIVRSLRINPSFIVAKGGWTSSAIARDALGVRRAFAPGPILPGVPQWILGAEARFPGLRYIVFPGNVGEPDSLCRTLALTTHTTYHTIKA